MIIHIYTRKIIYILFYKLGLIYAYSSHRIQVTQYGIVTVVQVNFVSGIGLLEDDTKAVFKPMVRNDHSERILKTTFGVIRMEIEHFIWQNLYETSATKFCLSWLQCVTLQRRTLGNLNVELA